MVATPFKAINSALNSIKNVSILGAKPFSWLPTISVPQIPLLANGGFFKANQPTLAMVGDNKTQNEIVTPENAMEGVFDKVLNKYGLTANSEIIGLLRTIIELLRALNLSVQIDLDGDELSYRLEKIKKENEFCRNGG